MTARADLDRSEWKRWEPFVAEDLRVARGCLDIQPPAMRSAAYHCQQAAEKLIKGLLAAARMPFRRTHDLDELASIAMPAFPSLAARLDRFRPLTLWGVDYRYPMEDDLPEPSVEEVWSTLAELEALLAAVDAIFG